MNTRKFQNILLALNPRLRIIHGGGRVDGLYMVAPRHPDSNPDSGLKHLGAMPSSRSFTTLPANSWWDDTMGGFNRGYKDVVRRLMKMKLFDRPIITKSQANHFFGYIHPVGQLPKRVEKTYAGKQRLKDKYQIKPYQPRMA